MVEELGKKKIPLIDIKKYQEDMQKQPIHLYQWFIITDVIAELIDLDTQWDIMEKLHNLFYLNRIERYKRLYKIETGELNDECIENIESFISDVKDDDILGVDFEDLRPLYIRAMACIFGVTTGTIRHFFPRRTEYAANAIGDLEKLADDLDATELYDEPLKELMGIEPYDMPMPKFNVLNDVNNQSFPRLQYIREPRYHPICGDLKALNLTDTHCNCENGCTNSCPCRHIVDMVDADDLVGGCTDKCGCKKPCKTFKYREIGNTEHMLDSLEVFMTSDGRGWGVRALRPIEKGDYIGEYVGEVYNSDLEKHRQFLYTLYGMLYTFGIDRHISHEQKKIGGPSNEAEFYLDATYFGNITRFFNHDCQNSNLEQVFCNV